MPALRKLLKRPETYLVSLALALGAFAIDASRNPSEQISVRLYSGAIGIYQRLGRPLLRGHIVCRYQPTCSEFSREAVEAYGIVEGLHRSYARVKSCTPAVPMGTNDPVYAARVGELP